jgi:hypothetical protein
VTQSTTAISVREHLSRVLANALTSRGYTLSYGADIHSSTNDTWSRCAPLFETEAEAKNYGLWLTRKYRFVTCYRAFWSKQPANASFDIAAGVQYVEPPREAVA